MTDAGRLSLEGVHAVVTGASRGIGAAIAESLAERGATLTIMARDVASLDAQAERLRGMGAKVEAVPCDVTDEGQVGSAFARAVEGFGAVGILVNNAGAAESALAADTTRALWDRMLAANLTSTYLCTMQVLPAMLERKSGRIVNVASTAGLRGYKTMGAYAAAKHGVIGYTRSLALEAAKHGVTVNAVCPGYTETDITTAAVGNLVRALGKSETDARAMLVRPIPRGQLTTPAEVAAAVAWLCDPLSAAITGVALPIAGGEVG
jgi:NAD(P)-dependent dehydrogenase (short-subunit alcohol dehydrogenase family)